MNLFLYKSYFHCKGSAFSTQYCLNDKTEKNEMGGVCRGRRQAYTGFWWGNLREGDRLGDPGIDGRIILRWTFRKWDVEGYGLDPAGSG